MVRNLSQSRSVTQALSYRPAKPIPKNGLVIWSPRCRRSLTKGWGMLTVCVHQPSKHILPPFLFPRNSELWEVISLAVQSPEFNQPGTGYYYSNMQGEKSPKKVDQTNLLCLYRIYCADKVKVTVNCTWYPSTKYSSQQWKLPSGSLPPQRKTSWTCQSVVWLVPTSSN